MKKPSARQTLAAPPPSGSRPRAHTLTPTPAQAQGLWPARTTAWLRRWGGSLCGRRCLRVATAGLALLALMGPGGAWAAPEQAASVANMANPAAALLPVETFFRFADVVDVKLSPSGRQLAISLNRNDRVALAVLDLDGGRPPRLVAAHEDADVLHFDWVNEDRLVYTVTDQQRGGGDQDFWRGLISLKADGGDSRLLVRLRRDFLLVNQRRLGREPLDWNHELLAVLRNGGDEVIVGKEVYSSSGEFVERVPLLLNVVTQRVRSLGMGMPAHVSGWLFDSQGEPRVATAVHEGMFTVYWRGPASPDWVLLATMPNQARTWTPHSVDDAGGLYVVVPEGPAGARVLKRFDLEARQPSGEALVKTPGFDFTGSLVREPGGPVLGVRAETDAETTVWFDPKLARWQQDADRQLPGRINRLICRRCTGDDPVMLVQSWSDQHPGELWLYWPIRAAPGQWQPVGAMRRDVDARRMATLDFHRVRTRDGLEMPVWLTLPLVNGKPASAATPTRLPAVVLVHGGPWVRGGHWRWNGEAQFLASRGYVVIEPEFRGSAGYGAKHFRAGIKQWGQAMQDDLADATQWAIAQGWVDKDRVCIAGGSYGGYAALMGPIRNPGLYRCVAAWAAVTDLMLSYGLGGWSDLSEENRIYSLPQLMGDPKTDAAMLTAFSPLTQAAKLRVPVLLVHGAQDRRVPLQHGERLRDALTDAGNAPEWVVYPDEGHGWYKAENRFDFARRLEAFLAKHLK